MSRWYTKIFKADDKDQAGLIMDACDYYEREYEKVREFINDRTKPLATVEASISGWMEICVGSLQDMETIMDALETLEAREKLKYLKHYLEHYNRSLTDRMAEKYADGEDGVYALRMLRHYCANVRNQYQAGTKALDCMQYQLGHITKLKVVGLDDATFR